MGDHDRGQVPGRTGGPVERGGQHHVPRRDPCVALFGGAERRRTGGLTGGLGGIHGGGREHHGQDERSHGAASSEQG